MSIDRSKCRSQATTSSDEFSDNECRVAYAMRVIEQLARQVIQAGTSGTIGVEIPYKDGKLGRVKRLHIDFQAD